MEVVLKVMWMNVELNLMWNEGILKGYGMIKMEKRGYDVVVKMNEMMRKKVCGVQRDKEA
ncbi:hypothetical protein [Bacillus sp. WP8]|uniref:hypothetical protein n=1 Tax=Bacillus sp. WP8 TaxID=756828 RepID=UPI00119D5CC2|nr:hypothetical protein [Bacillus sp. WP8]